MQVFKTFFKIVLKNLGTSLIYLVIFTMLAVFLANSSANEEEKTYSSEKIDIAVFDRDNSILSNSLYDFLDETQNIVDIANDEELWQDSLFYEFVSYILVIEKGFQSKIEAGEYEDVITSYTSPSSKTSYIVSTQTESYLKYLSFYINSGESYDSAAKLAKDTALTSVETSFMNADTVTAIPTISYFVNFVPYIMVCVLINALAPMLMIWNRSEIKARTNVSRLESRKISGGLISAAIISSMLVYAIFLIVSMIIDSESLFSMKGFYYAINMLACTFVTLAITFLIAQISKKQSALAIWSNVYGLGSAFLCGIFVSKNLLSDEVISASRILPAHWYINVTEELRTTSGTALSSDSWFSMLIQIVFAVAIFGIALVIIRTKRQKY